MAKASGGDRHPQASRAGMVVVRFFLGAYFLYSSIQFLMEKSLSAYLFNATAPKGIFLFWSPWPPFTKFLAHSVHSHAEVYAWIIILGGALAGALFLFGFLTRLAALITIPISLFFLLATYNGPAPHFGFYASSLAMELAVLISAAGRTWGFDALLARRTRIKLLW